MFMDNISTINLNIKSLELYGKLCISDKTFAGVLNHISCIDVLRGKRWVLKLTCLRPLIPKPGQQIHRPVQVFRAGALLRHQATEFPQGLQLEEEERGKLRIWPFHHLEEVNE